MASASILIWITIAVIGLVVYSYPNLLQFKYKEGFTNAKPIGNMESILSPNSALIDTPNFGEITGLATTVNGGFANKSNTPKPAKSKVPEIDEARINYLIKHSGVQGSVFSEKTQNKALDQGKLFQEIKQSLDTSHIFPEDNPRKSNFLANNPSQKPPSQNTQQKNAPQNNLQQKTPSPPMPTPPMPTPTPPPMPSPAPPPMPTPTPPPMPTPPMPTPLPEPNKSIEHIEKALPPPKESIESFMKDFSIEVPKPKPKTPEPITTTPVVCPPCPTCPVCPVCPVCPTDKKKCPPPKVCPNMQDYIRKDQIPCWGCKID